MYNVTQSYDDKFYKEVFWVNQIDNRKNIIHPGVIIFLTTVFKPSAKLFGKQALMHAEVDNQGVINFTDPAGIGTIEWQGILRCGMSNDVIAKSDGEPFFALV